MTETVQTQFDANQQDAKAGIACIMTRLRTVGLSQDQLGNVEVALAEAVNNIVEHAYQKTGPGTISITSQMRKDYLCIDLRDQGSALPNGKTPAGHPANVTGPRKTLPEGGFGWFLIRQLTDHLTYRRDCGSNLLRLEFNFDSDTK